MAYRYLLPRALTGGTPRLMPPWRVSWRTLSGRRFRATAHLIDSGDTCRFYPAPFRSSATGESVSFCFGRICRPSNRGRPQAIFESVSSRRQAGMGRSAPRIGRDPVPNRRAAGQAPQGPRPCGRWLACGKNSTDVRRNQQGWRNRACCVGKALRSAPVELLRRPTTGGRKDRPCSDVTGCTSA